MTTRGITARLAQWAAAAACDPAPPAVVTVVVRSVLDWVGCALAGSTTDSARIAREVVLADGGTPVATIVGTGARTSVTNAALVNGVAGHAHDFDDSGAHPSSYLSPTVLALGEQLEASGAEVAVAWAIGFEISSRVGAGLQSDRGWHSTPVRGVLGSAVAAGALLGLDDTAMATAIGIAASQASGLMRNFGTSAKSWHPAHAARCGIEAARLAAGGFSATQDVIEAQYGYVDCFGGPRSRLAAIIEGLGDDWRAARHGPEIKAWPTCSSNHAVLTAIEALQTQTPLEGRDVRRVDHWGAQLPGTGSLQFSEVQTGLQGKFSLEYNIAAALIDGRVDLASFTAERCGRGDLQRMMQRVHRHQDPAAARASERITGSAGGQRLRIEMVDGTVHDLAVGSRRTLDGDEVLEKFRANAQPVIGVVATADLLGELCSLDRLASLEPIVLHLGS